MSALTELQLQELRTKYADEIPEMSVPGEQEFQKLGIVQQAKLTLQELVQSFNNDGNYKGVSNRIAHTTYTSNPSIKQQFDRWVTYMEAISNSFDGNKYNMILKEQFIRTFGDMEQVKQLNKTRQDKKDATMAKRMQLDVQIEGIDVYKDIENGYYYKKSGTTFTLIGKKDLSAISRESNGYNDFKQLILQNSKQSAIARSKRTNEQMIRQAQKKRSKNIYLQQGQLNKYRKQLFQGKPGMTRDKYLKQTANQYQTEEIVRLQAQNAQLNQGLPQASIKKIDDKRKIKYRRLQIRRDLGQAIANEKKNQR